MNMKEDPTILSPEALDGIPESQWGEVLSALEAFVGPEISNRVDGLERLISIDAHRRSPLVTAIMARHIDDPEIRLRQNIIGALAVVLKPGSGQEKVTEDVRIWLRHVLGQMRQREIFAVLQVISKYPEQIDPACIVLNACSFSGEALIRIVMNRKVLIDIRIAAANAIGRIGFLEAGPDLRRLKERLIGRKAGQMEMAFAPGPDEEAEALLPVVIEALQSLEGETD
jgi:hypothetical protein